MATRLRGYTADVAPVSPAFGLGSSWAKTTDAFRCLATDTVATAGTAVATYPGTSVANDDTLICQNIWGPIAAQTVGGAGVTIKGQRLIREESTAVDARAQVRVFICAPDGSLRGVCLEKSSAALSSEFPTVYQNRKFPLAAISPATLTAVVAQAGDFLVWEEGFRQHGTNATGARTFTSLTDNDLPEDETTAQGTGSSRSWIEISQTIALYVPAGRSFGAIL